MHTRPAFASLSAATLLLAACGSGSDTPAATEETSPPSSSPSNATSIDPSSMPAPGTFMVEVDGQTYTFAANDPGVLAFDCELADGRVELDFQSSDNTHSAHVEYGDAEQVGGEPGTWLGNFTVSPRELDSGASYHGLGEPQPSEALAIAPPHVKVVVDATFKESPTTREEKDAGTATITATCSDSAGQAGAATTSEIGTPDANGRSAVVSVDGHTYDYGAEDVTILCAATLGILNSSARDPQNSSLGFGYETILFDATEHPEIPDPPYIWVKDDPAGVGYVAGPVPGKANIDPGSSEVTGITVDGDTTTATATFVSTSGSSSDLIPGTLTIRCP